MAVIGNRQHSLNNLKQIGLALINYGETHKRLPPQAIHDNDGKPLLSWRVLILPYLEEGDLYEEFKKDEPWDSPHNKKLLAKMPKIYAGPGQGESTLYLTYYQVFVGKGAGFEEKQLLRLPDQFPDGCHNTLAVAEAGIPVPWSKPADLAYAADQPVPALGGLFDGIFNGVMFDGSVSVFKMDADPALLLAAVTRNGSEPFRMEQLQAKLATGLSVKPEKIQKVNRELLRRWERARVELEILVTVTSSSVPLDDPETNRLINENRALHHLLQTTQARIEELKAAKKKHP